MPGGYGRGGAIYAESTTWDGLSDSTLSLNQARGGNGASMPPNTTPGAEAAGGAVYTYDSTVTDVERVTFSGNVAAGGAAAGTTSGGRAFGGALYLGSFAWLGNLASTTFDGNEANGDKALQVRGGAIYNDCSLVAGNVTFESNKAQCATCMAGTIGDGGAIYSANSLSLSFATLSGNVAGHYGGGIYNLSTAFVARSIVAGNTSGGGGNNCAGSVVDSGYNLSNDASCGFGTGDNTDPKLSASGLADHGGPTHTISLDSDSPALDAIPIDDCSGGVDQRGTSRPQDGPDADEVALCDIGAVELSACPPTPATCLAAGKNSFALKDDVNPAKRSLKWKWNKGALAAVPSDFGDPVGGTPTYAVCVYDETSDAATLETSFTVLGGLCGSETCWKPVSTKGWVYKDKLAASDGITKLEFKGGEAGKPSISVGGKGTTLPWPTPFSATEFFDQDSNVTVQLHLDYGATCWSSSFPVAGTKKNTLEHFKASNP